MQSAIACLRPCSLPICSCSIAIKPGVYSNAQSNRICWGISKFSDHRQAAVGQHQSRVHIRNPPTGSSMPAKSQLLQLVASNSWKVKSKVQPSKSDKDQQSMPMPFESFDPHSLLFISPESLPMCELHTTIKPQGFYWGTKCGTTMHCASMQGVWNAVEVRRLSASRAWIVEEFPGEEEDEILIGQNHLVVSWIKPELQKMLAQSNKAILSTQTLAEMTLKAM